MYTEIAQEAGISYVASAIRLLHLQGAVVSMSGNVFLDSNRMTNCLRERDTLKLGEQDACMSPLSEKALEVQGGSVDPVRGGVKEGRVNDPIGESVP